MIVTLTPNLSLDRVLTLDRPLVPGQLHRVTRLSVAAGGKGVNLARAVRAWGGEAQVMGFAGGHNGRRLRELLDAEELKHQLTEAPTQTRECHILPGDAHPTEIYEAGDPVPAACWTLLLEAMPPGSVVAVCGSLPPGTAPETFTALLRRLDRPVVDSSGPALQAALEAGVRLIKPNEHELTALAGEASVDAARALYRRYGCEVLLTLGVRGAVLVGAQVLHAQPPAINAVNPVGSGDVLLGTFLWMRERQASDEEALRLAVAAGAANAAQGGPLAFTASAARELAGGVALARDPVAL